MPRWSKILQFLAALLFLMQVPLHMQHSLIMDLDPTHHLTQTDQVASDTQTHPSGSGHDAHLHHQDHQASGHARSSHDPHQDKGNEPESQTSESMPTGKHQNHDCTCCMPMISQVPAAISLFVNLKGKHHLFWTLPNRHLLALLRATARGPPVQPFS